VGTGVAPPQAESTSTTIAITAKSTCNDFFISSPLTKLYEFGKGFPCGKHNTSEQKFKQVTFD
jgi:hypothetical protein